MKKRNIYKFLYLVSVFLIIGFGIRLGVDYFKYDSYSNSVPFYVIVIERAAEFIVPSIIIFIVAKFVKKKDMTI